MARKRNIHFSVEEKTDIICNKLDWNRDDHYISACKIAKAIDDYTFLMLDELVKAIREIAKGKGKG